MTSLAAVEQILHTSPGATKDIMQLFSHTAPINNLSCVNSVEFPFKVGKIIFSHTVCHLASYSIFCMDLFQLFIETTVYDIYRVKYLHPKSPCCYGYTITSNGNIHDVLCIILYTFPQIFTLTYLVKTARIKNKVVWVWTTLGCTAWISNDWLVGQLGFRCKRVKNK